MLMGVCPGSAGPFTGPGAASVPAPSRQYVLSECFLFNASVNVSLFKNKGLPSGNGTSWMSGESVPVQNDKDAG